MKLKIQSTQNPKIILTINKQNINLKKKKKQNYLFPWNIEINQNFLYVYEIQNLANEDFLNKVEFFILRCGIEHPYMSEMSRSGKICQNKYAKKGKGILLLTIIVLFVKKNLKWFELSPDQRGKRKKKKKNNSVRKISSKRKNQHKWSFY